MIIPDHVCFDCHDRRARAERGETVDYTWGFPAQLCDDCQQVEICRHYAMMTEPPHRCVCNACHLKRYGKQFYNGHFIHDLPALRTIFGGTYVGGHENSDPNKAFLYTTLEDAIKSADLKSSKKRRYYILDLGIGYVCLEIWQWHGLLSFVSNDALVYIAPKFPTHNIYIAGVLH